MKLTAKYFFLADILFLGVVLNSDKYIFPWQMCYFGGSSLIRVVLHSGKYGNWRWENNKYDKFILITQYNVNTM
jgi:hypothetical protein